VGFSPQHCENNADWIFVTVSFVISIAAPTLAVAVPRNRAVEVFRRPSLTRQPFGWWSDTLQPIRLVLIGFLGAGAAFALKNTDGQGVMLFYWFVAMGLGWFIGERVAYAWLRDRVVASAEYVPLTGSLEPRIFYFLGVVLSHCWIIRYRHRVFRHWIFVRPTSVNRLNLDPTALEIFIRRLYLTVPK
jgi:hypothetical protein